MADGPALDPERKAEFYRRIYFDAQKVLDKILGPDEEDGAGDGLVADIYLVAEQRDQARAELDNVRGALRAASETADRFRDVLTEVMDLDKNPGNDELVGRIRRHFGKTGPEPTRWRDFGTPALAVVDQINADRRAPSGAVGNPEGDRS